MSLWGVIHRFIINLIFALILNHTVRQMAGQNSETELDLIKTEERSSFVKAGKLVISNVTCSNISLTLFDFWYGALCML